MPLISTKWESSVFDPVSPTIARIPVFPKSWRRIFAGKRRTYLTHLTRGECKARLDAVTARESPGLASKSLPKAIGLVEDYEFRIVLLGGMAGGKGLVPMLYGRFEAHPTYTLVHAFQAVPKLVGFGVLAYSVICTVLMLMGPIPRALTGNSLTNDFTFDVVIVCFTLVSLFMVLGWMWLIQQDWNMPRFEFLAETLEAQQVDDGFLPH